MAVTNFCRSCHGLPDDDNVTVLLLLRETEDKHHSALMVPIYQLVWTYIKITRQKIVKGKIVLFFCPHKKIIKSCTFKARNVYP